MKKTTTYLLLVTGVSLATAAFADPGLLSKPSTQTATVVCPKTITCSGTTADSCTGFASPWGISRLYTPGPVKPGVHTFYEADYNQGVADCLYNNKDQVGIIAYTLVQDYTDPNSQWQPITHQTAWQCGNIPPVMTTQTPEHCPFANLSSLHFLAE